jgi:DNA uptake protein ComE-like DNA-binding protein
MKHFSFGPFKEWFGYTRRERRSSFILLIMILVIASVRFVVPEKNMNLEILPLDSPGTVSPGDSCEKKLSGKQADVNQDVAAGVSLLELNSCDSASLEALPGIGPVLSARIIRYRSLLGGYVSVSQLREVYGLNEETFLALSGKLKVDASLVRKTDINKAGFRQLSRFPYLDRNDVIAITRYRNIKGKIEDTRELVDSNIITPDKMIKISGYLDTGR